MSKNQAWKVRNWQVWLLSFFLCACAQPHVPTPVTDQQVATQTQSQTPVFIDQAITLPAPEQNPANIWVDPLLPGQLTDIIFDTNNLLATEDQKEADILLRPYADEVLITHWKYLLAVPFYCTQDTISSEGLHNVWSGVAEADESFPTTLIMSESTLSMVSVGLGLPASSLVKTLPETSLLTEAWSDTTCQTWAVLPFEELRHEWKVILLDGETPFTNEFDLLTLPIYSNRHLPVSLPALGNFDIDKMTTLNMTGVTALVRATARTMEKEGLLYPAEDIGEVLRNADFTHISNEVSFAQDCPYPQYTMDDLVFCSDPKYLALLDEIGVDIVELTGDHLEDWGVEALRFTLERYDERQWLYYGGGSDITEAKQPLLIDHNGNQLIFMGCNAKSPAYARAAENRPGTWYCDWPFLIEEIQNVRIKGFLPIITIQHKEYDQAFPTPEIITHFQDLADAGAVIVLGSQAHQPQTFDLSKQSFIHYGLGNLFFDQYNESLANRDAFIDQFTFYNNQLINVRLFTTVFVDWAKPRWMTEDERVFFLNRIFEISNWDIQFE